MATKSITVRPIELTAWENQGPLAACTFTLPAGSAVHLVPDLDGLTGAGWVVSDIALLVSLTGNDHDPKYRYVRVPVEVVAFAHNPDVNPAWTPKVAARVYACGQCGTEQTTTTNHDGTVPALRCVGRCRQITNPHTSREVVSPYHGPHQFVREA